MVFCGSGFFGEEFPDALVAIGGAPVEGDGVGVVVGGDAVVCGGEEAVGWIDDLGELVVGDGAGPLLGGVECVGGDWADGAGVGEATADGDCSDGVVADVSVVVGVDEVLSGASEGGESLNERGGIGGGVDGEEGRGDVGGIVDGPAEREDAFFGGESGGDDRRDGGTVLGGGYVEDFVFAAFDVDDFLSGGGWGARGRRRIGTSLPRMCSM